MARLFDENRSFLDWDLKGRKAKVRQFEEQLGKLANLGNPTPCRWAPSSRWAALQGRPGGVTDVNNHGTAVDTSVLRLNGSNPATPLTTGLPMAINDSGDIAATFVNAARFSIAGVIDAGDGMDVDRQRHESDGRRHQQLWAGGRIFPNREDFAVL